MNRYHNSREEGDIWNWVECDNLEFKKCDLRMQNREIKNFGDSQTYN